VTLNWNAPTTGGLATSYVIEAGSSSGSSNLAVFDTGNDLTSFVAGGVPNGIYYVRVRARNAGGTSPPSNEVVVVVGTAINPPGPPTNLVVSVVNNSVNLSWTAPTTGGAVTSYVLEAGDAPGGSNLATFDTGNTATGFTAFAVPTGTYFVRVRARNAAGTSTASNEVVILVGVCSAPPSAPSPLTFVVAGNSITLNWTAPGGQVTTYVIEAGSQSGAVDLANVATGNTNTSLVATATSGTYFVRVRARNMCGTSGPSNEVVITIP
jgi:predicted phage tail protein